MSTCSVCFTGSLSRNHFIEKQGSGTFSPGFFHFNVKKVPENPGAGQLERCRRDS
jgi:hypothetical protein